MGNILRKCKWILICLTMVFSMGIGVSRLAKAATAIELTATGVYNAINAILTNVIDAGGIIGLDSNGQLSIQSMRAGATLNIYDSSGKLAGTLTDNNGAIEYSGCNVVGVTSPQ